MHVTSLVSALLAHGGLVPVEAPQSYLSWAIATGSWSGLLTLLIGLAVFIGACRIVRQGRRPAAIASYLVLLPLPVCVAMFGQLKGIIASMAVISATNAQLTAAEIAGGVGQSALLIFLGMAVTLPSYFVIAYGLLSRTLRTDAITGPSNAPATH